MDRNKRPRELEDASVELVEEARREALVAAQDAANVREELARTKATLHAVERKEVASLARKLADAWFCQPDLAHFDALIWPTLSH